MKPELSVIIVNYNGLKYLKGCFDSLYKTLHGIAYEIIVIDNKSGDGSCGYIRENYPDIKLIESPDNLGFGKGNNEAVKHAQGNYLLLINNDTIVLDSLTPVLNYIKADDTIGVLTIKMLNADKEYTISTGKFPDFSAMLRLKNLSKTGRDIETGHFSKEAYEVDWLSGSFLLMPKKVYDAVGGFDEDYFMYVEDIDLSRRIYYKGYRRVFLSKYSYIHFVGFNKARNPLLIQGFKRYIKKHYTGITAIKLKFALTINALVKRLKSTFKLD
ncbi:glycosyltransferase family 2 protein [Flavobacterium salilacus subsp. salilacus]|uniref:glycosyltransferase family 2 protein n=1 Tax=Flavobacterium TaxID=237 RepID=UPI00107545B6|nr:MULTISPECIES: glycosyltransferase family 2 protein [Flavobacterium]KAF2518982.1 glycosyltransferase family 2 protein [Flavobacterium salilacus subsp. salilacus]MBE1614855.1 glycosyltransferase family 2 protein [Flavobacterium sp. SaA2.13]